MIKNTFLQSVAMGSALVLSMAFAAPTMAEHHCTAEEKKLAKVVKGHGLRVVDFSQAPEHCVQDFASKTSGVFLTLVAESDSQAYYDATIEAAKRLKSEGAKVQVLFSNDKDGSNKTATTIAWANGVKRNQATSSTSGDFTINHIAINPEKVISYIQEVGLEVWSQHLQVPAKVPDLAMNN